MKKSAKWNQQLHIKDDGEVVLIADKHGTWKLGCKLCAGTWLINSSILSLGKLPDDFVAVKDGKIVKPK